MPIICIFAINSIASITGNFDTYLNFIGFEEIISHEKEILDYATKKLSQIEGLTVYGNAKNKACVFSFLLDNIHHFDTGMMLDKMDIAVRTGTHCTQLIMDYYNIEGTVRASFAMYNTKEEIDYLYESILNVKKMFE